MAERFDEWMRALADEANAGVDYAAMREAVLKKAAAQRKRRREILRYGSMAAAFVILLGTGAFILHENAANSEAAPRAVSSEDATGIVTENEPVIENALSPADSAVPDALLYGTDITLAPSETNDATSAGESTRGEDVLSSSAAGVGDMLYADSVEGLCALLRAAHSSGSPAIFAPLEWFYVPAAAAEGYALHAAAINAAGVFYAYLAADGSSSYELFIPLASLSGTEAPADASGEIHPAAGTLAWQDEYSATWPLGDGTAVLTVDADCPLAGDEEALLPLCAVTRTELE